MPELFWNIGAQDKKKGLDVLGLRGVDQELERRWVAGITTISFRARYLSMLAWLCAEVFERSLAKGGSDAVFDKDEFERVLRRFEAVVFFSTHVGRTPSERGATFGVLNSDLLQAEANDLTPAAQLKCPVPRAAASSARTSCPPDPLADRLAWTEFPVAPQHPASGQRDLGSRDVRS